MNKKGIIFISNTDPLEIVKHGFSDSIQNFVVRNTIEKHTVLFMQDEYFKNVSKIDINSIFD